MSDWHPTSADLAVLDAEGASETKDRLVLHLLSCAECWQSASDAIASLESRQRRKGSGGPPRATLWEKDPALGALLERFHLEQGHFETALVASAAVADLRRVSRKARREAVVRDRKKHTGGFVRGLLSESRATSSPPEAEEWAGLALMVCQQIATGSITPEMSADLQAECLCEIASARRRSARWNAAREALRRGHELANGGTGSAFVRGMLSAIEGLIEGDCGNLERAEALLSQAAESFASVGARGYAAKARIQIAYVLLDVSPERSIEILAVAMKMIPDADKRLTMFAESIRIDALITRGQTHEALLRFDSLSTLYEQFGDPFVQLRRRFTAGRLLESLGSFEEADSLFAEVIAADLEQRSNKSYFLDQIYMVGSYLRRDDAEGVLKVCKESIAALSSMDLDEASDDQMRKLWSSIAAKVQSERLTVAVITAARQYIKTQWRVVGGDALLVKESAV
jgi:tetratricopeptide (TPR) repeat protein